MSLVFRFIETCAVVLKICEFKLTLQTCIVAVCVPDMLSRVCDCDWDDKGLACCWRIGCKRDVDNCVWFC